MERGISCVVIKDKKILLVHRTANRRLFPNKWHIISGKIENGQSVEETLSKELKEELHVHNFTVVKQTPPYTDSEGTVQFYVYPFLVTTQDEIFVDSREHDKFTWISPSEIDKFEHIPALKKTLMLLGL